MTNARDAALLTPESTRRISATAIGGPRPRQVEPEQRRPITSVGSSLFDLDATRNSSRRSIPLQPLQTQHHRETNDASPSEFDVRKFLLDQRGCAPLHSTALFRGSVVCEGNQTGTSTTKKLLPRMEHTKKNGLPEAAALSHPEDDTVSHFYTIEKLSESCFHAVQSRQHKIWQFLPGAEERSKSSSGVSANASSGGANSLTNVERPSRRVDVADLEKCFDLAMHFVDMKCRCDVELSTSQQLATLDRDVMTIQAKVVQRYATARDPIVAMHPGEGGPSDSRKEPISERQKALARTLFEQKWSDVVLGEIEAMLTKSFLEQGMLLRKTRSHYAKAFFKLERQYNDSTKELVATLGELHRTREELRLASETHAQDAQQMKNSYEEEIRRLSVGFESRREEMERKVIESKEQMTKMGDTMKTLNTIFRQMREDTDKVKAVELRENYIKLEKKFDAAREELERLRPLVQLNQRLHEQKEVLLGENNSLKEKIASFEPLLASKDEMIAGLMEQQSELIASQELRAAQEEELRRMEENKAAEDEEEEDDFDVEGESDATNSPPRSIPARSRGRGTATVCVRCKESLRTMSQVGALTTMMPSGVSEDDGEAPVDVHVEPRKKRVQCMYFRILLPNLRGRRPQRELSWTLSCMRSIIFAKQLDDSMCKRSGGAFPLRIRMPEFVYSWFSPWRSLRNEKAARERDNDSLGDVDDSEAEAGRHASTGPSKERTEEHRLVQADEDRWCLYYGVKALVQEGYLEAKLFLSLLDEKYGEDEQVFMLYCYRVLDVLLGGKINWGPMREYVSYDHFSVQYEKAFGSRQSSSDLLRAIQSGPRVPKTIWISPYHASLATSIVLGKATEAERAALDKKLLAFAVTNLSEQERPTVYLSATHAEALVEEERGRKKAKKRDENLDEDREVAPLQFIDANLWVELMMMEYKEEQAHRRAAIRLMFQTATSSTFSGARGSMSASAMDMEQFRIMIRTLNDEIPSFMVATLFRAAFTRGNGGVNFESFLEAAEYTQFFSSCMRLENPVASIARLRAESGLTNNTQGPSHAAMSTSARAAYLVDKYFTLMHREIETTTSELPVWTRSLADRLVYELSSSLIDENGGSTGGGALADGIHLLTSFHRLLDALLLSTLVKKDATGGVLSSKNIFCLERALQALLDCIRVGEKTTVEQLIDTVRQNLSVKRVQNLFRKHLQRDDGAPLVMRPLFHPLYATQRSDQLLSARCAERPLNWLEFVISDVLRRAMRSETYHCLLLELSTVSSVLCPNGGHIRAGVFESNGGIGVAPKSLLVEILYDSFVERFGTRCEAEKLLHDVFVNCRAFVREHQPVAMLFAYLCCMSDGSPDDRLMGQNEAVAFLLAVLRCGVHAFRLINPLSSARVTGEATSGDEVEDLVGKPEAEMILFAAFGKLGADQKQRVKMRLDEQLTIWKTPGLSALTPGMLSGSFVMAGDADLTPQPYMVAEAFLILVLNEWKRYVQYRMNELRVICCSMEDEIAHFGGSLPLDTIATILAKADMTFSNEELCAVFRRLCLTEQRNNHAGNATHATHSAFSTNKFNTLPHTNLTGTLMSDRFAAACFPLVARETLVGLKKLEHASPTPFKLIPHAESKAKFLTETWRGYDESCHALLEDLRRLGKNNDIQAEAVSRRAPVNGGRALHREVLHLSSSASADKLSSQDVAQLEALLSLFLERLDKMNEEFSKPQQDTPATKRNSVRLMNELNNARRTSSFHQSGGALNDEARDALLNSRLVVVNETWKMFRQLVIMFTRLRSLAGLGDGALQDKWDVAADSAATTAPPSA